MDFLTSPAVSLALALAALVLVLMFDKHTTQQIEELEVATLKTGNLRYKKMLIMLRLKVSSIWLLFLVPIVASLLSLP